MGIRPEVVVQLELHRAVLAVLQAEPGRVRTLAAANLARARPRARSSTAQGWLDEWEALLAGPLWRLETVMLGLDERSIDLRQISPFAGALSDDQRLAAIARARPAAARDADGRAAESAGG